MRKSSIYIAFAFCGGVALLFLMCIYPHLGKNNFEETIALQKKLVNTLKLTDLCLFTEASYTRNLSLADLHTPFQDYPMAIEHFPSGSVTIPSSLVLDCTR